MWPCDLLDLLKAWPETLLIKKIWTDVKGRIVIDTTCGDRYVYVDYKIIKL